MLPKALAFCTALDADLTDDDSEGASGVLRGAPLSVENPRMISLSSEDAVECFAFRTSTVPVAIFPFSETDALFVS